MLSLLGFRGFREHESHRMVCSERRSKAEAVLATGSKVEGSDALIRSLLMRVIRYRHKVLKENPRGVESRTGCCYRRR